MNKCSTKIMVGIMLIFIAGLLLTACGGQPASAPTSPPASKPTSAPAPISPPRGDAAALRAKGEQIYQKTAGGVGCQSCHGTDAKGGNLGPDVRGETADDIKRALGGDAMSFIRLSNDDIEAVAVYLKSLESQ